MSGPKLQLKVGLSGGAETAAAFAGVKTGVRNRVLKAACGKQARKAVKVAKAYLSRRRTGQLGRSIGSVYKSYRSGDVWLYVAGPRKGFKVRVSDLTAAGPRVALKKLGKRSRAGLTERQALRFLQSYVDPAKYAHLVEGGRKAVRPVTKRVLAGGGVVYGKSAFGVQPRPFMHPAAAAVAGSKAEMVADVRAGIDREAAKYAAKGKTIKG